MDETRFQDVTTNNLPLPERVADQIVQLIISRNLQADEKHPNEFELAELLNVGRGSIREAIKILVARNVVEIRRGVGTFVTKHPGQIEDPLGFAFFPDKLQLAFDLLEVRMELEPWMAGLASQRATPEDIQKLKNQCLKVEDDILSGKDHLHDDLIFHKGIAKCTHNEVVPKLIPVITYSVGLFGSLNGRRLLSQTIIGHRKILEAIESHDREGACQAMREHLEQNRLSLVEVQKEREEKTDLRQKDGQGNRKGKGTKRKNIRDNEAAKAAEG